MYTSSILVVASNYLAEIIKLFYSYFVPRTPLATALLPNGFWRSLLNGDLQLGIDQRGGILLHSRHHMAVKIQGDAYTAMAQPFAGDFRVKPLASRWLACACRRSWYRRWASPVFRMVLAHCCEM